MKRMVRLSTVLTLAIFLCGASTALAMKARQVETPEPAPVAQPVTKGKAGAPTQGKVASGVIRVAVYPVKTDGFELNGSEVTEINRIAMQACYDAGLRCSGRGHTVENVKKEQGYGGGKIAQSQYVAEFTLVGKTRDKVKLGLPGGFNIGGGYGVNVGGGVVGGGLYTDLSGLGLKMDQMALAGQVSDTSDGTLVYSEMKNKLGLGGSFIVGEAKSSNSTALLKAFREMFLNFKGRVQ